MKPSNILHINTLSEEWCDKDGVLLHACFQLLTDFVEQETEFIPEFGNDSYTDWESDEKLRYAKKEMLELYHWWKAYQQQEHGLPTWEDDELENQMLKRLIDIRWAMWT